MVSRVVLLGRSGAVAGMAGVAGMIADLFVNSTWLTGAIALCFLWVVVAILIERRLEA